MSTVHNRYEVSHPGCGVIDYYQRWNDAIRKARLQGVGTVIFDLMARRGQWELFEVVPFRNSTLIVEREVRA